MKRSAPHTSRPAHTPPPFAAPMRDAGGIDDLVDAQQPTEDEAQVLRQGLAAVADVDVGNALQAYLRDIRMASGEFAAALAALSLP